MDEFGDYREIISLPNPAIEDIASAPAALRAQFDTGQIAGYVRDSSEIANHGSLSSVLFEFPSVRVERKNAAGDFIVTLPGTGSSRCLANVIVDGQKSDFGEHVEAFQKMFDENFFENSYRCDAELGFRIFRRTGRKPLFHPSATLRHLMAKGGNRLFGQKGYPFLPEFLSKIHLLVRRPSRERRDRRRQGMAQ